MIIEDEVKMKNPQLCFVLVECPIGYVLNWGQGPREIFFPRQHPSKMVH